VPYERLEGRHAAKSTRPQGRDVKRRFNPRPSI
jgi:hypothetical protein